jgi:hypothetical protein
MKNSEADLLAKLLAKESTFKDVRKAAIEAAGEAPLLVFAKNTSEATSEATI